MYIAPSGDHSLLTYNVPFKVIQRKFEVIFLCLFNSENDALLKGFMKIPSKPPMLLWQILL